jgi:3-hydroxyacyl-CoA dehydrogenase
MYAANRVGSAQPIADRIEAVDDAMRWGFNWELGPFQTWDALGVQWIAERLRTERRPIPAIVGKVLASGGTFYGRDASGRRTVFVPGTGKHDLLAKPDGTLTVAEAKEQRGVVAILAANRGAKLVDLGDGIACVEFQTKLNTIDGDVIAMLTESISQAGSRYRGLVIGNDAPDFSVGANLAMLLMASRMRQWKEIERLVKALQDAHTRLKYSPVPVVVAPSGRTLGGGCEIMLHAARVRAHAELYCGLVEVGAGLIPAGGGCKEMLLRHGAALAKTGPFGAARAAFEIIALAKVSTSAEEARELRFLRKNDPVTLDRDRLIADAKSDAISLAESGYTPPEPPTLLLPGDGGRLVLQQQIDGFLIAGTISEHDAIVAGKLAYVLTGGPASPIGPVTETEILDLEREAFLSLCGVAKSQARMNALLQTGKPLRN